VWVVQRGTKGSAVKREKSEGLLASFLPLTMEARPMSYAGKDPRARRVASTTAAKAPTRTARDAGAYPPDRELSITARGIASSRRTKTPSGAAYGEQEAIGEGELDWQHIAIFTAGAVLGAAIGAGAALLFAPQSGARTRHNIARRGRHFRTRTTDAWDDLRHELRYAARRGRKKLAARLNGALRDRRERQSLRDGIVVED
jgi:gas vesicle protein